MTWNLGTRTAPATSHPSSPYHEAFRLPREKLSDSSQALIPKNLNTFVWAPPPSTGSGPSSRPGSHESSQEPFCTGNVRPCPIDDTVILSRLRVRNVREGWLADLIGTCSQKP